MADIAEPVSHDLLSGSGRAPTTNHNGQEEAMDMLVDSYQNTDNNNGHSMNLTKQSLLVKSTKAIVANHANNSQLESDSTNTQDNRPTNAETTDNGTQSPVNENSVEDKAADGKLSYLTAKTDGSSGENEQDDGFKCGECCSEFETLQKYLEHACSQSEVKEPIANSNAKSPSQDRESVRSKVSEGDISEGESFDGKIVYNPDGSAYIIEGESDLSDSESLLDVPQQEGTIVDHRGKINTSQMPSYPQVANAFYIQRNTAFYNTYYMYSQNNKTRAEAPIMHSYKVYDLRGNDKKDNGKNKENSLNHDDDHDDDEDQQKIEESNVKTSKLENSLPAAVTAVPTKPILMCFICKLSFGYAKSFVAHAISEHTMSLNGEEKDVMSQKNASAIIQGLGKDKEPLMSFLEPNISTPSSAAESSDPSRSLYPQTVPPSSVSGSSTNVSYVYPTAKVTATEQNAKSAVSPSDAVQGKNDQTSTLTYSRISKSPAHNSQKLQGATEEEEEEEEEDMDTGRNEDLELEHRKLCDAKKKYIKSNEMNGADMDEDEMEDDEELPEIKRKSPMASTPEKKEFSMSHPHFSLATSTSPISRHLPGGQQQLLMSTAASTSSHANPLTGLAHGVHMLERGCDEHPQGKQQGVECPKCDMVLGSSRSLGGHMTMMHSRNSCKTLKCPKCNWHYKYQETLEIHMKEKHPENDTQCVYCITSQAHPRLARGEAYTCGYKPYRCDVCNYSTTTKGNLSIHMQSDKHINNMQELQNGSTEMKMPPAPPVAPPLSPATAVNPNIAANDSAIKKNKPKPTWRCDVCNYETNVARNLRIHMTSEKHTHNMMVLQQNVKHMQQDMQFQLTQMAMLGQDPGLINMPGTFPQQSFPFSFDQAAMLMQQFQAGAMPGMETGPVDLSKETTPTSETPVVPNDIKNNNNPDASKIFQCSVCNIFSSDSIETLHQHMQIDRTKQGEQDVANIGGTYVCNLCTYKTNLKANFQLHCKTDKHIQRLQLVNHIREGGRSNEWRLKYMNMSNPVQVKCNSCDYYTNSIHKLQLHTTNTRHEGNSKLFIHLQCKEANAKSDNKYYHCSLCNFSSKAKLNLIQHVRSLKHMRNESMRLLQLKEQGKEHEYDLEKIFTVKDLVDGECIKFDEGLGEEDEIPGTPEGAETKDFQADQAFRKALVESAAGSPYQQLLPRVFSAPPNSLLHHQQHHHHHQQQHLHQHRHRVATPATLFTHPPRFLHKIKGTPNAVNNDAQIHTCPFCTYSSVSKARIDAHIVSQHTHQRPKSLFCPLCQEGARDKTKLENHLVQVHSVTVEGLQRLLVMVDQSDMMSPPGTPAPSSSSNQNHTAPVEQSDDGKSDASEDTDAVKIGEDGSIEAVSISEKGEIEDQYRCQTCSVTFQNIDALYAHQNELGHLELKQTPRGPGYLCWKKGCNQYFKTAQALQVHFREIHAKRQQLAVSERHVYKYRCNQCSLAFKTMDKLQLHSQYHRIRAATKCFMCARSFRSIDAMRKHVETTHLETMTEAEIEQYKDNLAATASLGLLGMDAFAPSSQPTVKVKQEKDEVESPEPDHQEDEESMDADTEESSDMNYKEQQFFEDYINSQAIAEDSYNDPNRKYKCHRCKVAFTKQNYLTAHNKTLMHRKGDKMSYPMEKYLDPNRPFKCDVCKESFTQKNILLVHYNSVSHLHKQKQVGHQQGNNGQAVSPGAQSQGPAGTRTPTPNGSQQSVPSTPNSASPKGAGSGSADADKKPYKCNICNVSYSQGTTLDIHMRSVLHQTRASKLQELALTGQVDLTLPLVEQPDSKTSQHKKILAEMLQQKQTQSQSPATTHPSAMICQQPFLFNQGQHLASFPHMSHIPLLQAPSPQALKVAVKTETTKTENVTQHSLHSCQRCNSIFATSDALTVHQQRECFSQTGTSLGYPTRGLRFKPHVARNLLENIGFDIVMQFNEYNQRVKKEKEEKDVEDSSDRDNNNQVCTEKNGDKIPDKKKEEDNNKNNKLPEINRCHCGTCGKQFSSVWVLKSHQEEIHKDIVPMDVVEEFSEAFRESYEKKQPQITFEQQQQQQQQPPLTPKDLESPVEPIKTLPMQMPTEAQSPVTSSSAHIDLAALQAAQMMQMPMLNMMHMHMPQYMHMPPPMVPILMPPNSEAGFVLPHVPMQMDPAMVAAQKQQQLAAQSKRARTRINDEQLKILRAHFDINNSPSEEQIMQMSEKSGLPTKVIKHWFRNTLFKERQRNKDSPYNFNNPPSTTLNLEEYEKTGKVEDELPTTPLSLHKPSLKLEEKERALPREPNHSAVSVHTAVSMDLGDDKDVADSESIVSLGESAMSSCCSTPAPTTPAPPTTPSASHSELVSALNSAFPTLEMRSPHHQSHMTSPDAMMYSQHNNNFPKRANRTRFTDYQLKMLQEYFDTNAYPKDDDLDHLSKLLNLSPRVIVVWFQNARQKARKSYENQPPVDVRSTGEGEKFQRTPGLNYQCNKCHTVFQRYYELIKHQKSQCFKDDNDKSQSQYYNADDDSNSSSYSKNDGTYSESLNKSRDERDVKSPGSSKGGSDSNQYKCEKCNLSFARFDLWKEHQNVHSLNPNLFPNYPPDSAFAMLQNVAAQQQQQQQQQLGKDDSLLSDSSPLKRRVESEDESFSDEQPRDKRLRTTILPEQLDYLYQKYQVDCNPSRKQLETISTDVGLKKRVVQVWFQNTRARERKGQFRAHQQLIYKRCPFCRALFRAKSALEAHLATKHPEEMAKGEICIDSLPDASQEPPSAPTLSKTPNTLDMAKLLGNPYNITSPFMPMVPPQGLGGVLSPNEPLQNNMKKFYEDSLKKYLDELSGSKQHITDNNIPTTLAMGPRDSSTPVSSKGGMGGEDDAPLDLSKPLKVKSESERYGNISMSDIHEDHRRRMMYDDSISETHSESTENDDGHFGEVSPSSPNSSTSSNKHGSPNKRYRTQMTNVQIKCMKNLFVDYKTPTMVECEMLGREIGLAKRVVQVWFQNARAKEKKHKMSYNKFGEFEGRQPVDCKLCNFKYSHKYTIQDHIFTKKHIDNVKKGIMRSGEGEREYGDSGTVSQLMNKAETDNIKPEWQIPAMDKNLGAHPHLAQLHAMGLQAMGLSGSAKKESKEISVKKEVSKIDEKAKVESTVNQANAAATQMLQFGNFPMPGAEMSAGMFPYLYPGMGGFLPGMGMPMMQPGMFPGPESMFMYDPATFGTPLTLLQIPPEAIKKVQEKLQEPNVTLARYTQDCSKHSDLKDMVASQDFQLSKEAAVDVGYICKKCHMVYPGKEACMAHQQTLCYQGKTPSSSYVLKLEQVQFECMVCQEKLSTVQEYKTHTESDSHKLKVKKTG